MTTTMNRPNLVALLTPSLLLVVSPLFAVDGFRLDAVQIGKAADVKAVTSPDGVIRITWARDDVPVTVDGMDLHPSAGLNSWAAFTPTEHGAMVMGDMVVFEDEVSPAMDAAFAGGLEVTALHNHFFYDEPKVYFMHIGGMADQVKLATAVKGVWGAIRRVRAEHPRPARRFAGQAPKAGSISAEPIEKALGYKAETQGSVARVPIGRKGTMHGVKVGSSMGLNTMVIFAGSDELAAVNGDFIMTSDEVQPVLRALRKADINIVSLHNHMIGSRPVFYFAHIWGKGTTEQLARGIRSALDAQNRATKDSPHAEESHANEDR